MSQNQASHSFMGTLPQSFPIYAIVPNHASIPVSFIRNIV